MSYYFGFLGRESIANRKVGIGEDSLRYGLEFSLFGIGDRHMECMFYYVGGIWLLFLLCHDGIVLRDLNSASASASVGLDNIERVLSVSLSPCLRRNSASAA